MKILVIGNESHKIREMFRDVGHDTHSHHIDKRRKHPKHVNGDTSRILTFGWDVVVLAPSDVMIPISEVVNQVLEGHKHEQNKD